VVTIPSIKTEKEREETEGDWRRPVEREIKKEERGIWGEIVKLSNDHSRL